MLMLTTPLLLTLSILFTQLSHPLAMGLTLLIQTMLISITAGFSMYSFWTSYILFLVFLGGMLVLFIYVTSIASNEPLTFISSFLIFFSLMFVLSFLCFFLDPMLISYPTSLPIMDSPTFFISTPFTINWIYNTPSMVFTIFIISYLLLMLLVVVKIVTLFKGPLRLSY
uniref:NADH-ubiquinone oxidoreductase chain 6 n=1 Tax=Metopograpsus quadridentatus TaxID=331402 RepID=A0A344GDJ1_9EUCA|nr:NADH dehydrogenase subunit 6 [Metopograpsus quadridentatus]AXA13761.1 NADH dehydrogenase subunit 6 [Metopograpsus quadridentatus]AYU57087.1 NADH dehydrogenase subunit 6 [Metopograpsus quadridentatus]UBD09537.1 NADH dehydrogenase subunit 6 [Metopograpsus quadridentatus]